jgi:hypothetical protein
MIFSDFPGISLPVEKPLVGSAWVCHNHAASVGAVSEFFKMNSFFKGGKEG